MYCPEIKIERVTPGRDLLANVLHGLGYLGGDLPGEMHVKTHLADLPRNEVICLWYPKRQETVDRQSSRLSAHQAGRASI